MRDMAAIELFARIRADDRERNLRDAIGALRDLVEQLDALAWGDDDPHEQVARRDDVRKWVIKIGAAVKLLEAEP